ncbi:uncharacterized protein LOC128866318 isoform X1 [Anastrepha ludens]|uniref:uncharacterized protein LOC128866318 isoform X1 n=1 Tax=Anastrepha ludens TaxID=28586 RepID=UPI0023AF3AA8|nr:uncharacterized protein LOC128866318 isoform X1 [Anastrepha ludens]
MFLNNYGEPVAVEEFAVQNLDPSVPLLLACPNPQMGSLPENWSGVAYTTRRIISELKEANLLKLIEQKRVQELQENKTTEINLSDGSRIFITPFLWAKGKQDPKLIFFIKDHYLTRIIVDVLANNLNTIISNMTLRKAIKEGIDIVHFNDGFSRGSNPKDSKVQHTWTRLHLLIYLIRPKKLCGLYETTLPKYITQCCSKPDFNRFVYM